MNSETDLNVLVSNVIAENQYKNCRLCLKDIQENIIRFHDNIPINTINGPLFQPLSEFLKRLLGNEICDEVTGVDAVCMECVDKVTDAITFIAQCEHSTFILHRLFDSLTVTLNNDVDIVENAKKEQSLYIIINEQISKTVLINNKEIKKSNSPKPEFRCTECKGSFDMLELLKIHNLAEHSTVTCEICYKTFTNELELKKHSLSKHRVKCPHCKVTKSTQEGLKRHQDRLHTTFICKDCGKSFQGLDKLQVHEQKHRNKNECPKCGKSYHTKEFFNKHVSLCLEDRLDPHPIRGDIEKSFYCEKCGKGYSTPGGLRVHHRFAHENAKPHVCNQCGKEFTAPSYLKIHMIKHTGEKNFKCDICSNHFVSKEALLYHTRRHTGEKPYSCKFCNEKFVNASARAEHIKHKHVGATWTCDICQRKFVTSHLLKIHMSRHKDPTSKLYCGRNLMPPNMPGEHNLRCKIQINELS